jgi:acetolactate synthase-1/2/3 large subunit
MLGAVTKWSALATAPEQIPGLVNEAFRQLRSGRPRPVGLEIPPDILQARADIAWCDGARPEEAALPEDAALERAATLLRAARFPVICAGGGAVASRADAAIAALADALQAPVVTSENGRGSLSDRHPLSLPALGGRCVLPHADVVLVIGSRFLDGRGAPTHAAAGAQFIYLNLEPADMTGPRQEGVRLLGDARRGAEALRERLGDMARPSREGDVARVRAWCDEQLAFIEPQMSYVRALRSALGDDGILVGEMTQVGYASALAYPVYAPGSYLGAGYQGTLGFGFATALGAAIGNPGRPLVSINGDGGFGWNLQELATAAKYRLGLVAVVFTDGAFGNVRRIQRTVFGREIATELHNPDFVKLAQAFGVHAVRVEGPAALQAAIEAARARGGPTLVEVPVAEMPGPWHLIHEFSKAPRPAPPNPLGEPARPASSPGGPHG